MIREYYGMREHTGPWRLPEAIYVAIESYADHGQKPGHFLMAVLTNNLLEAVGRADQESMQRLRDIVGYVHNELPAPIHGDPDKVRMWLDANGERDKVQV